MKTYFLLLFFLYVLIPTSISASSPDSDPADVSLVRIPLQFIANAGQWPKEVRFGALRGRDKVAFTREGLVLWTPRVRPDALPQGDAMPHGVPPLGAVERLELRFVAPSPDMRVQEMGEAVTRTNFYLGDDRRAWREGVRTYHGVRYTNVWPGIDVEYEEGATGLLQRVVLHEGADARRIAFTGAPALLRTLASEEAWSGSAARSAGSDAVAGDTARVRPYRNFFEKRKVIETEFTALLGGFAFYDIIGFDLDTYGNMYTLMITSSPDLPVREGFDTSFAGKYDLYLLALTPDGRRLRYATYIGGSDYDVGGMISGVGHPSRQCMRSTDSSAHILCNTRSLDFPMLGGGYQPIRPSRLSFGSFSSATALLRLDTLGRLTATTWLGHPTAYNGQELWLDSEDNVLVYGQSEGAQDFVTKGTLLDSLPYAAPTGEEPDVPHQVGTLLKLRNDYSRVVTGTYLFPNKQGYCFAYDDTPFLRTDSKDNIILVHPRFALDSLLAPIQLVNEWRTPGDPKGDYLIKISADMSRLLIVGRVNSDPHSVVIDKADGIVLAGLESWFSPEHLVHAMSSEPSYHHIIRFSATGGEPVFSTYHPFEANQNTVAATGSGGLFVTPCNDILVLTDSPIKRTSPLPFRNPLDTVNIGQSVLMLVIDTTGQHIRHLGYWHIDERYTYKEWNSFGLSYRANGRGIPSLIDAGGNLVFWTMQSGSPVDSITPLRSFEEIPLARGTDDFVLVRTRVPGCELLSCGLDMVDTVRLAMDEGMVQPQFAELRVELANIDPVIDAAGIECVLTLPPGLALDPDTQRARVALPGLRLRPGDVHSLAWRVRIDTSVFTREGDWVDVVTYYHDAERLRGTPSVAHCEHWLRFIRTPHAEAAYPCDLVTPDTLATAAEDYQPSPFPVSLTVRNTGTAPASIARFGLYPAGGMAVSPVPAGGRWQVGTVIPPGGSHSVHWQARALRRGEARDVRVLCTAEDALGNALSWCARTVHVPALDPLRCTLEGDALIRIDPGTGVATPDTVSARVSFHQVLDSVLLDVRVELLRDAAPHLRLVEGSPSEGPLRLGVGESQERTWRLVLTSQPSGPVEDTLRVLLRAGNGRWVSDCVLPVRIVPQMGGADCALVAPDSLSVGEIEAGMEVQSTYTLRNTGTIPLEVARVELALPPDAGLVPLDALAQPGGTLAPGGDITRQWRLRPLALRAERSPRLVVTAYNAEDSVLAVCEHTLRLPGVEGLRCALELPDSVRFDRAALAYVPDPVPLGVVLRNPLDEEETAVEAEVDLAAAPRLELAAGEPALRNLARVDSNASARIDWLLHALPGDADEPQRVRVRYRSAEHAEWKYCEEDLLVTAWPREIAVRCETGGHDTLHADAAYERLIPEPFEVSYALRNTGTITLRDVRARIVLPAEFELASGSDEQSYGDLAPGAEVLRWWSLRSTAALGGYGPFALRWRWWSEEQAESDGCAHSIGIDPEAPRGVVFTPLHLHFEAERDKALPPAQGVRLWTGGGLSMPWTLRAGAWWIAGDPSTGDHTTDIAVQPVSTALDLGLHASGIEVTGHAANHPADIAVTYRITGVASGTRTPIPGGIALGAVWPQPLRGAGRVEIFLNTENTEGFANTEGTEGSAGVGYERTRVTLRVYDMLGRERALLFDGPLNARSVLLTITPATLGLEPGSYMLRLTGGEVFAVRRFSVVR